MPDPNKIATLKALSYEVRDGCGLCREGRFAPGTDYGTCVTHLYEHAKHGVRSLSVHRSGWCPKFQMNPRKADDLARSGFDAFTRKKDDDAS